MGRLYIIGLAILLVAILANMLAGKLNIMSWYDYLGNIAKQGTGAITGMSFFDGLWLFLVYPFALGAGYFLGDKLYQLIFGS